MINAFEKQTSQTKISQDVKKDDTVVACCKALKP